jgi:hypothetical protein
MGKRLSRHYSKKIAIYFFGLAMGIFLDFLCLPSGAKHGILLERKRGEV